LKIEDFFISVVKAVGEAGHSDAQTEPQDEKINKSGGNKCHKASWTSPTLKMLEEDKTTFLCFGPL